jgi:hypothetical protein
VFGTDRESIRRFFIECRQKHLDNQPLSPLERLIVEVLREHPEYDALLSKTEEILDRDYMPEQGETNPFLHMGMHITLQEQLGSDRPAGIRDLYQRLTQKAGDAHSAEHQMMECLGLSLWEAQRNNTAPDEQAYLECIRRLVEC